MNNKYIVYVGGAYGGKEENKKLIEDAIKDLKEKRMSRVGNGLHYSSSNTVYFSPVHAFGWQYEETDYLEGLDYCLAMLDKCDELLLLDNWLESTGAKIEYGFAKAKGIPIKIAKGSK